MLVSGRVERQNLPNPACNPLKSISRIVCEIFPGWRQNSGKIEVRPGLESRAVLEQGEKGEGWPTPGEHGQPQLLLENILQPELHDPRVHGSCADLAESCWRRDCKSRRIHELWVIEEVECFRAEDQCLPLGDVSSLHQGNVEIKVAWTKQDSDAGVAPTGSIPDRGSKTTGSERAGVNVARAAADSAQPGFNPSRSGG